MDQLSAMRAFVRVAETASFSAVARESNTTQATISKRIAALEELLGVRLLTRSSREQSLTEAGQTYYQRCLLILEAVDEAESQVRCQNESPRGLLRVTAAVDVAQRLLLPLIREFLRLNPDIKMDLLLDNYQVDLVAKGIDVAIRAGTFEDSSLIAKPLSNKPLYVVASPAYLNQHGVLKVPNDLRNHRCLVYSVQKNPHIWVFTVKRKKIKVPVNGRFLCNNGDILLQMVLAGEGVCFLPYWVIQESLERGNLQVVLPDYALSSVQLNMVYPARKHLPLKTRYFLDFMANKAKQHPGLK